MTYAWTITEDHLIEPDEDGSRAVGMTGPRDAPEALLARLEAGEGHTFKLYDDDQILYYTGRLVVDGEMDEDECFAPLQDFGMGYAGCTAVRWPGHPEWDCS